MTSILTSDISSFITKEYRNFIRKRFITTENSEYSNYKYRVIDNKIFKLFYGFSRKNRLSNPNSDLDKILKEVKKKKRNILFSTQETRIIKDNSRINYPMSNQLKKSLTSFDKKSQHQIFYQNFHHISDIKSPNYTLLKNKYFYFKEHPFIKKITDEIIKYEQLILSQDYEQPWLIGLDLKSIEQLIKIVDFLVKGQSVFLYDDLDKEIESQEIHNKLIILNFVLCRYFLTVIADFQNIKKEQYLMLNEFDNSKQDFIYILISNLHLKNKNLDVYYQRFFDLEILMLQSNLLFDFLYKNNIVLNIENKIVLLNFNHYEKETVYNYLSMVFEETFKLYMEITKDIEDTAFKDKTIKTVNKLIQKIVIFTKNFKIDENELLDFIRKKTDYIKRTHILNETNNPYIDALYNEFENTGSKKVFFLSQVKREVINLMN